MGNTRKATCHCAAVELRIRNMPDCIVVRRCNCSICARKGALVCSVLLEDLQVVKGAEDALQVYTFGTHTAKHYFCKYCGIYTHHQRRSNPKEYGLNVACVENIRVEELGDIPFEDGRDNHPSDRS